MWSHTNYIKCIPYVVVRNSGSIVVRLFQDMVENITFDLYPNKTVSLEIEVDEHGRLVKGPVMWTINTGQGRLANLNNELWDEGAMSMIHGASSSTTSFLTQPPSW